MAEPSNVEDYLADVPADVRATLEQLRRTIKTAAPDATETISYAMPAFRYDGRFLLSYAGWKRHCSLYPLTDSFRNGNRAALEGYGGTKGSIHFTPERPLPDPVLDGLIRARVADLEGGRGY